MRTRTILPLLAAFAIMAWGQNYKGPRPPQPDTLYLVHADNLIPTEKADSTAKSKKNETTYTVAGSSSSARTPLAEPIFLLQSENIKPQSLQLYRMEVKGGNREVTIGRHGEQPLLMTVTRVGENLYRIEADQELENGEYAISPTGSNTVFCFQIF